MSPSLNRTQLTLAVLATFIAAFVLAACELRLQIPSTTDVPNFPKYEFEATGEDYLISALEEVQAIADWSQFYRNEPSTNLSDNTSETPRMTLAKTATDTVYIYGQIIPGGYGAVVTERYARPKGLPLITVRKTYGKANGHIVTETKRYVSYTDHHNGNPDQTNVTEMYGRQADTIVAHVLRNGTLETYTFRLPVVTRVVNPQDGSIRVTKRYASNGAIVSKVEDANGNLTQLSRNYGQSDGSTVTRTEFPDSSWRQVRTHGEADGTITRETTSGLPSLGSGYSTSPTNIPRPVMSLWIPMGTLGYIHPTDIATVSFTIFASGIGPCPVPPRPGSSRETGMNLRHLASGLGGPPTTIPRPAITCVASTRLTLLGSGVSASFPKPPLPIFASGNSTLPKPPLPRITRDIATIFLRVASGQAFPGTMPRPMMSARTPEPSRSEDHSTIIHGLPSVRPSLASGIGPAPKPPRPIFASGNSTQPKPPLPRITRIVARNLLSLASGQPPPVNVPRPVMSLRTLGHSRTEVRSTFTHGMPFSSPLLASGATGWPKPPRPIMDLFPSQSPKARPRFTTGEGAASGSQSLCSGVAQPMRPPPPPPLA